MSDPLLDEFVLAHMRQIQTDNMLSECDLISFVNTRIAGADYTRVPVIVATVPCRLSLATAGLPLLADQFTPDAQFVLTLPADTDTTAIERVVVRGTTDAVAWSVELLVAGIDEPRTFSASRRLRAKLATDAAGQETEVGSVIVEPV